MSKIAFYAPIKPPDHPIPSGDRLIARNIVTALTMVGHTVELASDFIAYSKREASEILIQRKQAALVEAQQVVERLQDHKPDVWLTYHPYCKAPDWIGPYVCEKLQIPYVTIEAAKTGQGFENGQDRWREWRTEAQAGIKKADLHLAFKPTDRRNLRDELKVTAPISMIPPFIDSSIPIGLKKAQLPSHWRPNAPTLLSVGMMRPGKKVENFKRIASALEPLQALHWNLVVIGGGPEEDTVKQLFGSMDENRFLFTGGIEHVEVLSFMKTADIFVWPGWKEPIGMVYLEAQMMGLPVAALDSMGVSLSVKHGETGLLAGENETSEFTDNLRDLISHPSLRRDLGTESASHIKNNHSLLAGAAAIDAALNKVL